VRAWRRVVVSRIAFIRPGYYRLGTRTRREGGASITSQNGSWDPGRRDRFVLLSPEITTSPTREEGGHMGQAIRELMTENPRSVSPDQTIQEAATIMRDEDTGVVPIADGGNLVGVVTDRDIAIRAVAEGKSASTRVTEVASKDLVTIDPDQDLDEALRLMAQHQVRRLPVVEEDGRLVGVVSQADVAREGNDARTGDVVQQISK
jgi:CBS domain-containing protein